MGCGDRSPTVALQLGVYFKGGEATPKSLIYKSTRVGALFSHNSHLAPEHSRTGGATHSLPALLAEGFDGSVGLRLVPSVAHQAVNRPSASFESIIAVISDLGATTSDNLWAQPEVGHQALAHGHKFRDALRVQLLTCKKIQRDDQPSFAFFKTLTKWPE